MKDDDPIMRWLQPQGVWPERDAMRAKMLAEYLEKRRRDQAEINWFLMLKRTEPEWVWTEYDLDAGGLRYRSVPANQRWENK